MANPSNGQGHDMTRQAEREWENNDIEAAANSVAQDEPITASETPSAMDRSAGDDSSLDEKGRHGDEKGVQRHSIVPITTGTRDSILGNNSSQRSSTWTAAGSTIEVKQTFWRNLNPLKWSPPPVPRRREIVSREYNAGWLSRLTFHWMQPMMTVSPSLLQKSIADKQ
jgi:ATP-binding cassette, subfamily C (CFTR/MRP), member 1